ncbi:MAG: chromate efflux transporter [Pikeienuella sp.]
MSDQPNIAAMVKVFGRIGILSFGGPAAQIALMHREVVENNNWLSERQFLNGLSFCTLLPGPEAMQLATYAGWRLHGTLGGLIAGLLFVLPGAAIVLALAAAYAIWGQASYATGLFLGVKAAVLVIVIEALLKVSRKALKLWDHWLVAALAFVGLFFFAAPYPLIVLAAAIWGALRGAESEPAAPVTVRPMRTIGTIALWALIWAAPFGLLALTGGPLLTDVAAFFSKLAAVTFGGAYAVLAYMAQDVVQGFGWLTAGEMLDGLGLAETTPGPLILVTEFVGFLAGYKEGGMALGIAAAAIVLWVTFAPCFLWIFAGAPYIEWISAQRRLSGALSGVTAAVVGVILNLSVWFGLHVLFAEVTAERAGPLILWTPDVGTLDWRVVALTSVSAVLMLRLKWGVAPVLAIMAVAGLGLSTI